VLVLCFLFHSDDNPDELLRKVTVNYSFYSIKYPFKILKNRIHNTEIEKASVASNSVKATNVLINWDGGRGYSAVVITQPLHQ
jgi:hypothetical protein